MEKRKGSTPTRAPTGISVRSQVTTGVVPTERQEGTLRLPQPCRHPLTCTFPSGVSYLPYEAPSCSPFAAQPASNSGCRSRERLSPWSPLRLLGQKRLLEGRVTVQSMALVSTCVMRCSVTRDLWKESLSSPGRK